MALMADDRQAVIAEAPITDLLIDVADGLPWEDLPKRKAAWDEIKRRDAALASLAQRLQDMRQALEFYADEKDYLWTAGPPIKRGIIQADDRGARARAALAAAGTGEAERPKGREGIATVYGHDGSYLGCIGVETWQRLLAEERDARAGTGEA